MPSGPLLPTPQVPHILYLQCLLQLQNHASSTLSPSAGHHQSSSRGVPPTHVPPIRRLRHPKKHQCLHLPQPNLALKTLATSRAIQRRIKAVLSGVRPFRPHRELRLMATGGLLSSGLDFQVLSIETILRASPSPPLLALLSLYPRLPCVVCNLELRSCPAARHTIDRVTDSWPHL